MHTGTESNSRAFKCMAKKNLFYLDMYTIMAHCHTSDVNAFQHDNEYQAPCCCRGKSLNILKSI